MVRRSPPRASRWVAKEWRKACGVALSGRPSAPRSRSIASWMMRGDSGPPLAPTNSGPCGFSDVGAERKIVGDRLPDRRDHRGRARLAALADDGHRVALAGRRVGAPDRQRFADAQARAIAERQHRGVAGEDPRFARLALARGGGGDRARVGRAQRPRQPPRRLGRAHRAERGGRRAAVAHDLAGERAQGGKRALQRARIDPLGAARGEKRAQIGRREAGEFGDARAARRAARRGRRETGARRARRPRPCWPKAAARRRAGRARPRLPPPDQARRAGRRFRGRQPWRDDAPGWLSEACRRRRSFVHATAGRVRRHVAADTASRLRRRDWQTPSALPGTRSRYSYGLEPGVGSECRFGWVDPGVRSWCVRTRRLRLRQPERSDLRRG